MLDIRVVTARAPKIVRYVWTRLFHPIWFWLALALPSSCMRSLATALNRHRGSTPCAGAEVTFWGRGRTPAGADRSLAVVFCTVSSFQRRSGGRSSGPFAAFGPSIAPKRRSLSFAGLLFSRGPDIAALT